jgi:adenylate cyclase
MSKPAPWRPTLRFTLGTFLFMIFLITGAVVLVLGYHTSRDTLVTFSGRLMRRVTNATHAQLDSFLAPTESTVRLSQRLMQSGAVDAGDATQLEALFFHQLQVNPSVALLSYGDEQGNYVMVKRTTNGGVATKLIERKANRVTVTWRLRGPADPISQYKTRIDRKDRFDPRVRPWYKYWSKLPSRRSKKDLHWTDVYVFHTDQVPGITCSAPLTDRRGALRGVICADVGLKDVSRFLSRLDISAHGKAFIVDGRRRLIAVPDPQKLLAAAQHESGQKVLRLHKLKNSPFSELVALSHQPAFRRAFRDRANHKAGLFSFSHDGADYFARVRPVKHDAGQGWLIGVVIPESDVLGQVKKAMLVTLGIIAAVMVVGIVLVLSVSRFVSGALGKLVRETDRVRQLELGPSGEAVSRFREVHEVLTAFERMKTGLRSFQKYVPLQLVRMLLRRQIEPKLGGRERELTIFFSDIRNFTTIGEKLGPQKLAEKLARYLTAVTRCIQAPQAEGTVDKYIGDAVVAFWNAPEEVADHPAKACRAALAALHRVEQIRKEDPEFPDFFTRVALHTGQAIVGHYGSEEHVAYTCIGDDVNLASRLEGLNKFYKTKIIISQAVLDRIGEGFVVRELDRVVVKGKSRAVTIYELIAQAGEVSDTVQESVAAYEKGLSLYRQRKWNEAIARFEKAAQLRSPDGAAEAMITRCRKLAAAPPDSDWQGVHIYETK